MTGSYFTGEATLPTTYNTPLRAPRACTLHPTHVVDTSHSHLLCLPFLRLKKSRVVPDFLVQTGDRTGTGAGGESFFGGAYTPPLTVAFIFLCSLTGGQQLLEQFEDEIHPRLRYAHRGLVAMANNGKKNSNDSQFIITLGAVKSYFMHASRSIHFWNDVDRADELHGKHTLFGRCVGDTIYSASIAIPTATLMPIICAQIQMS